MTVAEMLRVMETLWNDLSRHENELESPPWHADILLQRAKRVSQGKESFIDWKAAKQKLRGRAK
ncbi:MAG TPA: addiction module protein [Candidatus Baltobacteraceae bacterium]|jgi:hypothetical protein|nr:addiction module protein [Candidatus Baltobacteraceae bacterium]